MVGSVDEGDEHASFGTRLAFRYEIWCQFQNRLRYVQGTKSSACRRLQVVFLRGLRSFCFVADQKTLRDIWIFALCLTDVVVLLSIEHAATTHANTAVLPFSYK